MTTGVFSCDGCALTSGACANREPNNALTALICVRAGIPFYCHDGQPWDDAIAMKVKILRHQRVPVCQGWRRDVKALAVTGWFRTVRQLKHQVGDAALRALETFIRSSNSGDEYGRANALADLETYMSLLALPARTAEAVAENCRSHKKG